PRLVEANPYVEEARNQVAVMRGPLVYCVEGADLPEGTRVSDVGVSPHIQFKPRREKHVLGDIVLLEGQGLTRSSGEWNGQLYRDYAPTASRRIALRLIPYYAWGNRGESEMSVWLPLVG